MKRVDTETGAGRILKALKDLERVWAESSDEWADPVAHAFREEHLEPITPVVKNALDGVQRMRTLLQQAQRELEG